MENEYFQRSVLVTFKQAVDSNTIDNFKKGLNILAENASGLISMREYNALALEHENALSSQVPNVGFPDYMSTWLFDSIESLNAFICSTLHQNIAEQYFKPAVDKRVVFNSRVTSDSVNTAEQHHGET